MYNIEDDWNNYVQGYSKQHVKNKKPKKKNKKSYKLLILLVIIIILSLIFLQKSIASKNKETFATIEENIENNTLNEKNENDNNDVIEVELPNDTTDKQENITNNNPTEPEDKNNTTEKDNSSNNKNNINSDYSKSVPQSASVDDTYFKDAVFIGDSRTEGLILNTGFASKTKSYTHKGLKVDTVFTDKIVNMDGDKKTVIEALQQTNFSKVYIMLGINETGWVYSSLFIKKYGELIDTVKQINPNAIIYVQSILPVSDKVSSEHDYLHNDKINEYNSLIQQMTEEKQVYYVNVREAVETASGSLPEDAATDGIHLNKTYCIKWMDYLKNHVAQ